MRQHREERNIALRTIAEQTKIKLSLLDGLERDDISQWPSGIFRRAYLRTYAQAIGLEPDVVVREFLEIYPDPVEVVEPPPPPAGLRGFVARLRRGDLSQQRLGSGSEPGGHSANGNGNGSSHTAQHLPATPPSPPAPRVVTPAVVAPPPAPVEAPPVPTSTSGRLAAVAPPSPPAAPARADVDLVAAARLCTAIGRVESAAQLQPLLGEVTRALDARGLIVWIWDPIASQLMPALAHGYSEQVLAQLRGVPPDAENVTAAAYRSGEPMAINGAGETSGALAVPLLTPSACAGVLAIELADGKEESDTVRAVATFFAAILAQLVGGGAEPG